MWQSSWNNETSIRDLMCKSTGLHLNLYEIDDILMDDYVFVCVNGKGGKIRRFETALDKLPLLFFEKMLILIEFPEGQSPLFEELALISSRFNSDICSIGLYENPDLYKSRKEEIIIRVLYQL